VVKLTIVHNQQLTVKIGVVIDAKIEHRLRTTITRKVGAGALPLGAKTIA
jgi:hypothetical protein